MGTPIESRVTVSVDDYLDLFAQLLRVRRGHFGPKIGVKYRNLALFSVVMRNCKIGNR